MRRSAAILVFGWLKVVLGSAALAASAAPAVTEFDCMIEPAQVVELRSPVVGLLQQVHARRGDLIRRGQLLVTIESSVEQSAAEAAHFRSKAQGALELAQNKVQAAQAKLRRLDELQAQSFVSGQARDDGATELKLAQSELKSAREASELARLEHRLSVDQLNRRRLYSPFNGVVVDQYLYPGALVDPSDGKKPIMEIAQTDPLAVQAILLYRYFPQVKPGMAVVVAPEAPFGGEIRASIRAVDRVIDAAAGTFGVVAEINNASQSLPGGIRCKLRVPGLQ